MSRWQWEKQKCMPSISLCRFSCPCNKNTSVDVLPLMANQCHICYISVLCRKVLPGCGTLQVSRADQRDNRDRWGGYYTHRPAGPAQEDVHHPPGPHSVCWYRQVTSATVLRKLKREPSCSATAAISAERIRKCNLCHWSHNAKKKTWLWHQAFYEYSTFRYNLDPFNKHSDEELWEALQKTYLKDSVGYLLDFTRAKAMRKT